MSGYVRFVEAWGHGDAGKDLECGIIEAARQSTQACFRGWEDEECDRCKGEKEYATYYEDGNLQWFGPCEKCKAKGYFPGDKRLLAYLYNNKHSTPFEFSGMTLEIQAPIFVFREWHRHRTQSYNEMSARYTPMPNEHYTPTVERCLLVQGANKQAGAVNAGLTHESALEWLEELAELYAHSEAVYQSGLRRGVPKELARLPVTVARYSRMRATANLRNWLAFLTLRMAPDAQWEIRQYANQVGELIAQHFPRTWELYGKQGKASQISSST